MRALAAAVVVLTAAAIVRADSLEVTSTTPKTWGLGQWVNYRHVHGGQIGHEYIGAVARDSCGLWIERVEYGASYYHRWLFCFRADVALPHDLAEARQDLLYVASDTGSRDLHSIANRSAVTDFDAQLVTLFPAPIDAWAQHEDVSVPAGRFIAASHSGTTWTHPRVPFAGIVQRANGDDQLVLVGTGDCCSHSVVPELEAAPAPSVSRLFIAVGGGARWDRGGSARPDTDTSPMFAEGVHVTHTIDLMLQFGSPSMVLRTRWSPWGMTRHGAPYIAVDFGLDDTESAGKDYGANTVGAAIGIRTRPDLGWSLGLEVGDHVAFYGTPIGTRNSLEAIAFAELYFRKVPGMPF